METVSDRLGVDELVELDQLFRRHWICMFRGRICSTFDFAYIYIRTPVSAGTGNKKYSYNFVWPSYSHPRRHRIA